MSQYKVKINKVNWIDEAGLEGDVLFEFNDRKFWAFCHPCDFIEEEMTEVQFDFVEDEVSDFAFWNENYSKIKDIVSSENDKWRYYCYGQIKSVNPVLIDCGFITFSLRDLVRDESVVGGYVYFVISRLDMEKA